MSANNDEDAEAVLRRVNPDLERRVAALETELAHSRRELDSLSQSISHDLRAPLRAITGFSKILLAESSEGMSAEARDNLQRVVSAAERMDSLINGLLSLSRVSRKDLRRRTTNLGDLASSTAGNFARTYPERAVEIVIAPELIADADDELIRIVLENLLGNAWKFTSRVQTARIEVGQTECDGEPAFFVRDNGAGFDMRYAEKLFSPFQRMHTTREFDGIGIGLSIVQRIVSRHGGRIWPETAQGKGATFFFTIPPANAPGERPVI